MTEHNVSHPELSIVMAAYNSSGTLRQSVFSVLNQTFLNFELIIVNDGSTDDTEDLIKTFTDPRIRYLSHVKRKGAAAARNIAIEIAQGEYIGIMDSDDLAHPEKFEKQINFLRSNPVIGVLGCSAHLIDEHGRRCGQYSMRTSHQKIKAQMLFYNPYVQSSVVIRKSLLNEVSLYNPDLVLVEDYDLLFRLSEKTECANLKDVLVSYRIHTQSIMSRLSGERLEWDRKVHALVLSAIGIEFSDKELELHIRLKDQSTVPGTAGIRAYYKWFMRLYDNEISNHYYQSSHFYLMLFNRWMKVCFKARKNPLVFFIAVCNFSLYLHIAKSSIRQITRH